jgi:hypothetical protein
VRTLSCPVCQSLVRVEIGLEAVRVAHVGLEIVSVNQALPAMEPVPTRLSPHRPHRAAVEVITRVARENDFTLSDLRSPSRATQLVAARYAAAAAAREETDASLPAIGRILNRDHSTILHGLRRLEAAAR